MEAGTRFSFAWEATRTALLVWSLEGKLVSLGLTAGAVFCTRAFALL